MGNKKKGISNPSVGLLIEGITGTFQSGIWPGIVDAARETGIRLFCYSGGALDVSPQNKWEYQRNTLFDVAAQDRLDGYIISGSLGGFVARRRFLNFVEQFKGRPVISIGPIVESIPTVFVDNNKGMNELLAHLVRDHHYQSFAFIRGPEGNFEAEERYLFFKEHLKRHDIALDPDTVIAGDFSRESGIRAVDYLFEKKLRVDAIVASSDEVALGALLALKAKGSRVPDDVALVGFDDTPESEVASPPLTTVCQPMYELGRKAVELVSKLLAGEQIPSTTNVDATLKIRRSCGCFRHLTTLDRFMLTLGAKSKLPVSDMLEPDPEEVLCRTDPAIREPALVIVRSFFNDVIRLQNEEFLKAVDRIGNDHRILENADAWQALFFELWRFAWRRFDQDKFKFADTLLQSASNIRMELERRIQGFRRIKAIRDNRALRDLGQVIANTLDIDLLIDTMASHFPKLGIATFFLLLHDAKAADGSKPHLKLACVKGQRIAADASNGADSIPAMTLRHGRGGRQPSVFIVEPLYFQTERYGLLVCEVDQALGDVYEIVPEFVSGSLHSSILIRQVQRQAEALSATNRELERMQAKEHALLEALNQELENGRKIQKGFLPEKLPQPDGWEVAASFVPAHAMSGDFYDVFRLGETSLALVIADVCGKHVSAALFMALTCTLLRILTERAHASGSDPLESVAVINDYIIEHYPQVKERQMYITLFLGLLDTRTGAMRYCNAGHYPPLLVANGIRKRLRPTGPALGLIPNAEFRKDAAAIPPETSFFAYTDGVIDAENPEGVQFTNERLMDIVKLKSNSAADKLSQIEKALVSHINGAEASDDITMLLVRRKPRNQSGRKVKKGR